MTTLPSLPIEIFHHIVDELPRTWQKIRRRHDLKQLRLTCREIELKTRIRYGREFFFGLTVTVAPGCFEAPHSIMNDAIFRNSPTHLDIWMDNDKTAFDETVDFQATIEYTKNGHFRMDLESLLNRTQRMTSLAILSPRVSSAATMEIRQKIEDAWHEAVRATLAAISALGRLRLHDLTVGLDEPLALTTPTSLLSDTPSDSRMFDEMSALTLQKVTADAHDESLAPLAADGEADTVHKHLFDRMPKLEEFVYYGDNSASRVYPSDSNSIPPPQSPPLCRLVLGQMSVPAYCLKDAFSAFKATLTELTLESINLENGTWKDVFNSMLSPKLEWVHLSRLILWGNITIFFSNVHAQRSMVVGPEDKKAIYNQRDQRDEEGGAEKLMFLNSILQELESDFVWVFHSMEDVQEIRLGADEEPEEVRRWLAVVRDQHELV